MGLVHRLAAQAKQPPGIAFDTFMEAALYDHEEGYFATSAARAARQGDFITAPETSPAFAACIARHLAAKTPQAETLDVVEIGAGRGTLAHGLLKALTDTRLAGRTRLHLVERAKAPRAELERRFADRPDVTVHQDIADLPARIEAGALVANELFDNLPVRRVMQTDALMEIRLRWRRDRFDEELVPAPQELTQYFERQGVRLHAGQTAEVCLEAPRLLGHLVEHFDACEALIIDYGDQAPALYAAERYPNGTLACHRRHGTDRAYYQDVGEKDLTAHVNFTALATALTDAGFTVDPLRTQADFLIDNGLIDAMAATEADATDPFERMRVILRAKQLFHPDAMGEAFRVLTARRQ